jgi:hypothetical protein
MEKRQLFRRPRAMNKKQFAARARPRAPPPVRESPEGPNHFVAWDAYVDDHGSKRPAITIFEGARDYWTGIIYRNQIAD